MLHLRSSWHFFGGANVSPLPASRDFPAEMAGRFSRLNFGSKMAKSIGRGANVNDTFEKISDGAGVHGVKQFEVLKNWKMVETIC